VSEALYESARLRARPWRDGDRPGLAALCADAEVMRFFPSRLSASETDAFMARMRTRFEEDGFGFPAVERKCDGAFVGLVGVQRVAFDAAFAPAVEIGWRIARRFWRQGYALEAAQAALDYAFGNLGLEEVVSFTATVNAPSEAVMRRLGMVHDAAGDFDHPALPEGHPLRRHVLYRIRRPASGPA